MKRVLLTGSDTLPNGTPGVFAVLVVHDLAEVTGAVRAFDAGEPIDYYEFLEALIDMGRVADEAHEASASTAAFKKFMCTVVGKAVL